jgi:hypothetical protein
MARGDAVRGRAAYKWVLFLVLVILAMPALFWLVGGASGLRDSRPQPPPRQARLSEADLDAGFLLRLQAQLVAAQTARTREALRANGYSEDFPPPRVSSTYVNSNGHRYGLVRSRIAKDDANVEAVLIVGVVDGQLRRVVCTSTVGEVPISSGPCAEKIAEAFGVAL